MPCFCKRTEHFDEIVRYELIDAGQNNAFHPLEKQLFLLLTDELISMTMHKVCDGFNCKRHSPSLHTGRTELEDFA